ncbi:MAG: PilZ domain-containing protein [Candidatus Omnitrophota bacterium]
MDALILVGLWSLFLAGLFLFTKHGSLSQKELQLLLQDELREISWIHDRRRFKRRYLPLAVDYADVEHAKRQGLTLTDDVGKGGIQLPSKYPMRHGEHVHLSIRVPQKGNLSLFGEVVWQKRRLTLRRRYNTGIKFVALTPSNVTKIAHCL